MPRSGLPTFQTNNFLSTHTLPLALSDLPSSSPPDTECPICHNPYAAPSLSYVHPVLPADLPEYAVQIHGRGPCKHIFGRHCIERHITGDNPWCHMCPMCREAWFPVPPVAQRRAQVVQEVAGAIEVVERLLGSVEDEGVTGEVQSVGMALERIEAALMQQRWI